MSVASDFVKSLDLSLTVAATPPYKGKLHEEKRCFTALDENDFLERRDDYLTTIKDELDFDIMSKLAYGNHFDHFKKKGLSRNSRQNAKQLVRSDLPYF